MADLTHLNPAGEARMVDVFTFRGGKIAVKNAFRKDRPPIAGA